MVLICFLYVMPTPFEWEIVKEFDVAKNKTVVKTLYSDLGNDMVYKNIYYWLTAALFVSTLLNTLNI